MFLADLTKTLELFFSNYGEVTGVAYIEFCLHRIHCSSGSYGNLGSLGSIRVEFALCTLFQLTINMLLFCDKIMGNMVAYNRLKPLTRSSVAAWSSGEGWSLSLKFYFYLLDGTVVEPDMSAGFCPDHKAAMVLFLDRVYGIEDQDFLLHLLEVGFLPDLRAAASLDTVRV